MAMPDARKAEGRNDATTIYYFTIATIACIAVLEVRTMWRLVGPLRGQGLGLVVGEDDGQWLGSWISMDEAWV
jgi:hypothetical protein